MKDISFLLEGVQKPGRYIGREINSVNKGFSEEDISIVLSYPDLYEVGMSYLGIKILYHLLNERDGVVCERVFAPWSDMEAQLINHKEPLFSLESRRSLRDFDVLGFSLVYELTYTNILNIIDLAGIPVRSCDRGENDPLIIAGGSGAFNPEPLADFIDVFFVGDGEDVILEFVNCYKDLKKKKLSREEKLKELCKIKGLYVPSLYDVEYENGNFNKITPKYEAVPAEVYKNTVENLDDTYYPVKQIVPYIKIVHSRIAMEIMRGCPNKCRFCQARAINRPLKLRHPEKVLELCRQTYSNTGYENVALLSLSSVDYPWILELFKSLNSYFSDKGVGISIPSLKIKETFYDLPELISNIKKTGLTFAPETGNDSVRQSIGKDLDLQVLCKSASLAYEHGWDKLKLYFMVGFPGHPEDEAFKILDLSKKLSFLRKDFSKRAAEVRVSVNPFIPKPHTPFQWVGMKDKETLIEIKKLLISKKTKRIKIDFHDIEQSFLEASISRGDRRYGKIIYSAWKAGAKLDSWNEFFDFSIWQKAFQDSDMDVFDEATKCFPIDAPLPWDHIVNTLDKDLLKEEYRKSGFLDS